MGASAAMVAAAATAVRVAAQEAMVAVAVAVAAVAAPMAASEVDMVAWAAGAAVAVRVGRRHRSLRVLEELQSLYGKKSQDTRRPLSGVVTLHSQRARAAGLLPEC